MTESEPDLGMLLTGSSIDVTQLACLANPGGTHHLAAKPVGTVHGEPVSTQACTHCGLTSKQLRDMAAESENTEGGTTE